MSWCGRKKVVDESVGTAAVQSVAQSRADIHLPDENRSRADPRERARTSEQREEDRRNEQPWWLCALA